MTTPFLLTAVYVLAVPWLVAITVAFVVAVPTSAIFSFRANLTGFP